MTPLIANAFLQLITRPVYILIDKVDELWSSGAESNALIVGLLQATKEISEQFRLVHPVLFLRSDIFDALDFNDLDKFRSMEERITWTKADLKWLIALRARASTGLSGKPDLDKIWQTFFPAEIDGCASFDNLLRYTLMRPRELIQLCNLCRDKAQNSQHVRIEESDIDAALPQYSEWKLKDLVSEYRVQYPFLEKVFLGTFYHAEISLDRPRIEERMQPILNNLIEEFGDRYFAPITNLLQVLFNIGFLGAFIDGDPIYSFSDNKIIIPYVSRFEIHPAFRAALALTTARSVFIGRGVEGAVIITGDNNQISIDGSVKPDDRITRVLVNAITRPIRKIVERTEETD